TYHRPYGLTRGSIMHEPCGVQVGRLIQNYCIISNYSRTITHLLAFLDFLLLTRSSAGSPPLRLFLDSSSNFFMPSVGLNLGFDGSIANSWSSNTALNRSSFTSMTKPSCSLPPSSLAAALFLALPFLRFSFSARTMS